MGDEQKRRLANIAYDRMCHNETFNNMSMDAQGELVMAMVEEVDVTYNAGWTRVDVQMGRN